MVERSVVYTLIVLLFLHSAACYGPPRVKSRDPRKAELAGITTVTGDTFMFDAVRGDAQYRLTGAGKDAFTILRENEFRPQFRGDNLFAVANKKIIVVPVEEIEAYWFRDLSALRTTLLITGIVGGAVLLFVISFDYDLDLPLGNVGP